VLKCREKHVSSVYYDIISFFVYRLIGLKLKVAPAKFEVSTALLFRWLAGLQDFKPTNQRNIPEDQYPESWQEY